MMNGWDGWQMAGWGWGWMFLWGILILTVVVLLVWAIARAAASPRAPDEADAAIAVLRRRFAAGEIDQEEFERRCAALERQMRGSRGQV